MAILNYTTKIDAEKTVTEIQMMLVKAGANSILTEYADDMSGQVTAVSFRMNIDGTFVGFRLPADWQPILYLLQHDNKVPRPLKTSEQAIRVAWRIIKDWVEAQLAIIATKMVKPEQAFLPYMLNANGSTMYEVFASNPQLLLNAAGQEGEVKS